MAEEIEPIAFLARKKAERDKMGVESRNCPFYGRGGRQEAKKPEEDGKCHINRERYGE